MRIGIIGSIAQPVNLNSTGGTEVFCALLSHGLINKGHEVFLFASGDSSVEDKIKLIPSVEHSMLTIKDNFFNKYHRPMTADEKSKIIASINARTFLTAKKYEDEIDVFHDNTSSYIVGSLSNFMRKPIVTTMHMPPIGFNQYIELPQLVTKPINNFVAISKYQQTSVSIPSYLVYNGIILENFSESNNQSNAIVWIGRIDPSTPKGLKEAIVVASKMDEELFFSGYVSNQEYYENEIKPLIKNKIQQLPILAGNKEKCKFLSSAKLGLFPIQWEEPFGLVFLETMACGTPIIAMARGAVPEVIKDGETGFIVNSSPDDIRGDWIVKKTGIEGLCEAVERIYTMPEEQYRQMRKNCRAHVEKNFTVERMVDEYEKVYQEVIEKSKK